VPGGGVLITGGLAQGVGDAGKVAHVVPGEAGALAGGVDVFGQQAAGVPAQDGGVPKGVFAVDETAPGIVTEAGAPALRVELFDQVAVGVVAVVPGVAFGVGLMAGKSPEVDVVADGGVSEGVGFFADIAPVVVTEPPLPALGVGEGQQLAGVAPFKPGGRAQFVLKGGDVEGVVPVAHGGAPEAVAGAGGAGVKVIADVNLIAGIAVVAGDAPVFGGVAIGAAGKGGPFIMTLLPGGEFVHAQALAGIVCEAAGHLAGGVADFAELAFGAVGVGGDGADKFVVVEVVDPGGAAGVGVVIVQDQGAGAVLFLNALNPPLSRSCCWPSYVFCFGGLIYSFAFHRVIYQFD